MFVLLFFKTILRKQIKTYFLKTSYFLFLKIENK